MGARPFPLYVADYLADTAHLSTVEHGAYMLLMMHYWQRGSLPPVDAQLARVARMSDAEWAASRGVLVALFQTGWKHKRIEFELTEAARISAAGRKGGRASAAARRVKSEPKSEQQINGMERPLQRSFNDHANDQPTIGQPLLKKEDLKKENKKAETKKVSKGGGATRLPPEWVLPASWGQAAMARGLSETETRVEADTFRNHWLAKSGPDAKKDNWHLTWLNWVNKALRIMGRVPRLPSHANGGTPAIAAPEWDRGQWAGVLAIWRSSGRWMAAAGPEPGKPGCRVPVDMLKPDGGQ